MAKWFIIVLMFANACPGLSQEKETKFFRIRKAKVSFYTEKANPSETVVFKTWGFQSVLRGNRTKVFSELPVDTMQFAEKIVNSFLKSNYSFQLKVDSVNRMTIESEAGCPSTRRSNHTRKYPCTFESQVSTRIRGLNSSQNITQIVPVLCIEIRALNAPASGGAIFTIADSGYNWNYIRYTLELHIFNETDLIYYDQHSYLVIETLPDSILPDCDIPQSAMDSLVTLTMQGYVDRLK